MNIEMIEKPEVCFSNWIARESGAQMHVFACDTNAIIVSVGGTTHVGIHMTPAEASHLVAELQAAVRWAMQPLQADNRLAERRARREALPDPFQGEQA